jgi:hypothetical protein
MKKPPHKPHVEMDPFSGEFSDKFVAILRGDSVPRMVPKYCGGGREISVSEGAPATICCDKIQISEFKKAKTF